MAEKEKAAGFLLTSSHPESIEAMIILSEAGIDFSSMGNELENALPVFFPGDENRQCVGLDSIKAYIESFVENFKKRGEKSE